MVRIKETRLDAQFFESLREECPCSAIEAGGGDEVLAGVGEGEDRRRDGSLAAREGESADSRVERGQTLLEHIVGGIHRP